MRVQFTTDQDGKFAVPGLPAGIGMFTLLHDKLDEWEQPAPQLITIPSKEPIRVRMTRIANDDAVLHDAVLEGSVLDAETGTPLPGASVALYHGNMFWENCNADKDGHFSYHTQSAHLTLLVENPPHGYLKMLDTDTITVDMQEGKTVTVVLKLHQGQRVTGTVTDEEGKPASGASFSLRMPYIEDYYSLNDTRVQFVTDQQGKFEVSGLPVGKGTLTLAYNEPCYAWKGAQISELNRAEPGLAIEVPAKEPITLVVARKALHTVSGRVLDAQHHPLAGVKATFQLFVTGDWKKTAVTGTDGGYQLMDIPAGMKINLLSLEKAGYRQRFTDKRLTNDGKEIIEDAVMVACPATVRGKVCDADGKPVQGATVVSAEGGLATRAVTDTAGAFTLPNQPLGELHLVAATPTGGGVATCTEQATDIRIICTPALVATPSDIPLALALLDADKEHHYRSHGHHSHDRRYRPRAGASPLPDRRCTGPRGLARLSAGQTGGTGPITGQ